MLTINNTLDGYLKDVEILGNTIQDASNLADIRSVGDKVEGQELYEIPVVSCGKNLFNPLSNDIAYALHGGAHKKVTYKVEGDKIILKSNPSVNSDWGWIEFKNIKVTPNKSYTIHPNATVIKGNVCVFVFDGNNTKLFEIPNTSKTFIPTTKHITIRLYVQTTTLYTDAEIHYKPQLEEGTVATPYEPYQEDKLTILSPVQLEKVGDVADRIIEKDGVWGVEKNVIDKLFNGSENWVLSGWAPQENTIAFKLQNTNNTNLGICDKFILNRNNSTIDTEAFNVDSVWNEISIRVNKSKLPTQDVVGFKKWLSDNNVLVMYSDNTSQFIPLPHSQQIKLRTFANKTNISFGCEIEGTIKAQVPKSLGATVNTHTEQINNLNKELDRVKKLEESTVSTVETENNFTTVEATSNGYFEDVKLEGRTLVNLSNLPGGDITLNNRVGNAHITPLKQLTSSDTLYLTFNCTSINFDANLGIIYSVSYKDDTPSDYMTIENDKTVGHKKIKIIPKSDVQHIDIFLHGDNSSSASATISNVMLMYEKDYNTQNPPSFFEGLKSVGQSATTSEDGVDEISVESVNSLISQNLKTIIESSRISHEINPIKEDFNIINPYTSILNVVVFKGDNWVKDIQVGVGRHSIELLENECVKYINQYFENGWTSADADSIKNIGIYTKQDKKRLLYYNEETQAWEKPILREWDSIEKHSDGKYYYHQRSGEVVLNGSESWDKSDGGYQSETTGNVTFQSPFVSISSWGNSNYLICDVIPSRVGSEGVWGAVAEGITTDSSKIMISILKSKLPTQDAQGFKQWLQANNVTVVYQLAQEKVYECTNIDLITYANETNYIVESGAIAPKTTLKVHNNISNVVSLLQKKVSLLESNITSYMITQNRLMLASRYNADTVSFKVDVASLRNSFEYDNDLYELILNNILVGKDNYNREYIENLIIFYWMDFVISDEMYLTLFEIIEEQHNPKIIEEEETPLI